ncbi:MAG: glycosyltransferase family 39 protein [Mariprofundales bacterium]|nr:glycosyltransferase family 39 protein [Mariprofundales bacterium]
MPNGEKDSSLRPMMSERGWILVWLVVTLASLGLVPLFDLDEAIYAQTAWEMLQTHHWIVPQANGIHFFEKPPLVYYFMDLSFTLFGHNSFAARLPSLVFTLLTVAMLIHAGRRLISLRVGWLAALVFVSMLEVGLLAHAAILDAALNFFVAATLLFWWLWLMQGKRVDLLLAAAMMGAAVSVKGPVGVVVPLAIVGLERLLSGHLLATLRRVEWLPVVGLFLLTATPWYVMIWWQNGSAFLWQFIMVQNIGRALHPMQGHGGGWYYYLLVLAVSVLPWLPLLPRLLSTVWQGNGYGDGFGDGRGELRPLLRFLFLWTVVTVMIFSLAQTKLPHYISSIYPALALGLALVMRRAELSVAEVWVTLVVVLPVGLLVVALPWIWPQLTQMVHQPRAVAVLSQPIVLGWHHTLAAVPLLLLLIWLVWRRQVLLLAGVGVALQGALFFGVVPVVSALMQGPQEAVAAAVRALPESTPVFSYNLNAPSISFAARRDYKIMLNGAGREKIAITRRPYALIMRSESRAQFPQLRTTSPLIDRGGYLLFVVQ